MSSKYMVCRRCGIPFHLDSKALAKRLERNTDNAYKCHDCVVQPARIDHNAVWEFYKTTKKGL